MMCKFLFISYCLLFSVGVLSAQEEQVEEQKAINVLVFSKTDGYRHHSIPDGIKMISQLSSSENWVVTSTENSAIFTSDFLSQMDVVVFLNATHDVLNDKQQKNFEKFIKSGKGFVGIHAATDCEYDWPWYGKLSGAYFKTHPVAQEGTLIIEDTHHPAMKPFEGMDSYTTFDEWYSFLENPRDNENIHVLARLDENSIKNSKNDDWKMGDHPLIWYQEFEGSRSFYTVFGHTPASFEDENVQQHIAAAINWAARRID